MKTVLTFFALVCVAAEATPISTVLNASYVSINGQGRYQHASGFVTMGYTASAAAVMPGPFVGNLSGSAVMPVTNGSFAATEFALSTASQVCSADGTHLAAHGVVFARSTPGTEGLLFLQPHGRAEGIAIFDVIFFVSEPVRTEITGTISAQIGDASEITLSLLGSPPLWESVGNTSFDLIGALEPGTYRLTAVAQAISEGNGHEGDLGSASFDFNMDFFAVPETGATWTLLALGFGGLMALRRRA